MDLPAINKTPELERKRDGFRLPPSDFGLPPSDFGLPTSDSIPLL